MSAPVLWSSRSEKPAPNAKSPYTSISFRDVAAYRSILSVLFNDALADNTPLWNLVKKNITQDILDAIAAEHAKGRILLVGTTNLDALRPVHLKRPKLRPAIIPRPCSYSRRCSSPQLRFPEPFRRS